MDFEWDEAKDRANVAKHGVGFETAKRIFEGTILTRQDSRRDYGETRHTSVGRVGPAVLVVAHTRRGANLRLISARPASRKEREAYHEHTQKGP
ncbi:MAG: BrnT family toxin [Gammaproteobacteria bacterium]|nr:BrnT family toxin [Gammaproteobacteria bacterium]